MGTLQSVAKEASAQTPYDPRYLRVIPSEVLQQSYEFIDPTSYVSAGDKVLYLGAENGTVCFILCQLVGSEGGVFGIESDPDMLRVARAAAPLVALRVGYRNVAFERAILQNLEMDISRKGVSHGEASKTSDLKRKQPSRTEFRTIISVDEPFDVIIASGRSRLASADRRPSLLASLFRKLKSEGRLVILAMDEDAETERDESSIGEPSATSLKIAGVLAELERSGFVRIMTTAVKCDRRVQAHAGVDHLRIIACRPSNLGEGFGHAQSECDRRRDCSS